MLGEAPGSADTPRAHITNMAALGTSSFTSAARTYISKRSRD